MASHGAKRTKIVHLDDRHTCKLKVNGWAKIAFAVLQSYEEAHSEEIRVIIKKDGQCSTVGVITDENPRTCIQVPMGGVEECELFLEGEGVVGLFIYVDAHSNDLEISLTNAMDISLMDA